MKEKEESSNSERQGSLVKSMTQIANFSKKQLKKEDLNNLFKDFETLLKIDDINDLELSDFNSWDINLSEYQRALDLEFAGKFEEAREIYEKNNLNNDALRVQHIVQELNKEQAENEKYIQMMQI